MDKLIAQHPIEIPEYYDNTLDFVVNVNRRDVLGCGKWSLATRRFMLGRVGATAHDLSLEIVARLTL